MKLVVGLGNPGGRYADTRHNVGWMVLDRLADRSGWSGRAKSRDAAATARGKVGELDVMLVKPLTFMNDSGVAVRKILAREHVKLEDMLVVVDDFALPFGRLRMRPTGTAGGHNGLRSIIGELGTQDFARLRVGIGEPRRDAVDHVLSRFAADETRLLPALLDAAADAVESWGQLGPAAAANRWNAWRLEGTATPPAERGPGTPSAAGEETGAQAAEPGEVGGPAGSDGIRRTRTGWRRMLGDLGTGDR